MPEVDCDLLVIGSGFGGAVCACRAAQAGLRVIVLERGAHLTPAMLDDMAEGRTPLFRFGSGSGPLEVQRRRGLLCITGNAVGGGSQVYTAVTVPAPPEVFGGDWPEGLRDGRLQPAYDRVREVIRPSVTPVALPRTVALEAAGARLSAPVRRLPVAVDWPGDGRLMQAEPAYAGARRELVQWLQGGHATRKRPLDRTYLHDAVRHGAEIRPLHEVELIEPQGSLYRVTFRSLTSGSGCGLGALRARRVVLAAGTLGTVRLLLSCRDRAGTLPRISDRLGQRFFTNGDFGALIMRPQLAVDAGPPATAWIDLWKTDRLFVMDTGLVPLGAVLGWPRSMGPAWSLAVMGYDDNPGRLRLSDGGALVHEHQPSRGAPFHERRLQRLREVAAALEGRLLAPPSWLALRLPVTFHPLGGAALAQTPSQGVTDPYGEVFGHPGLYVADGSLMPTPLGAAPSMTIAALAEVVVEHLLRTW